MTCTLDRIVFFSQRTIITYTYNKLFFPIFFFFVRPKRRIIRREQKYWLNFQKCLNTKICPNFWLVHQIHIYRKSPKFCNKFHVNFKFKILSIYSVIMCGYMPSIWLPRSHVRKFWIEFDINLLHLKFFLDYYFTCAMECEWENWFPQKK